MTTREQIAEMIETLAGMGAVLDIIQAHEDNDDAIIAINDAIMAIDSAIAALVPVAPEEV